MDHFKQIETSTIFTIGHSSLDMESFISLLKDNSIDIVVDVRSNPYSRYAPQFSKNNIQNTMETNSIKYLFLGKELGGKPESLEYYDSKGYVLYSKIAESIPFQKEIKRLLKGAKAYRIALMCSEENPANCHRMLLIGRVLAAMRLAMRKARENTAEFKNEYRWRAGVEAIMSAYDRRTGVKHLRIRGFEAVRFCAILKAIYAVHVS